MGIISSRSCNNNNNKDDDNISSQRIVKNLSNIENNIQGLHLSEIKQLPCSDHIRQGSIRSRIDHPMPDSSEVDKIFARVLASMDLPPDKAKLLKNYDDEKKWSIICDRQMVSPKDPPLHYLTKLRTYLDPRASRSHRKRKIVGESTSTQVLRDLEISLRTNHIEWVKEFLDNDNQGLDALVDYLNFRLLMMRHEQKIKDENKLLNENNLNNLNSSSELNNDVNLISSCNNSRLSDNNSNNNSVTTHRPRLNDFIDSPSLKRRSRHIVKLNMGTSTDDIHVCIMCLRAIMNNKYGFNMVIQHREAINNIALSIIHKSLRTKALVLELLAAICLVKGGHEIILAAFDNFKEVYQETKRFFTLMNYFINYEIFNIDFMVACMQFVNIVVHSVEDMNYRVHLQYEFTSLGLDDYLEKLRLTESEELHIQISAYLDNVFDVASLMEDSETKTAALERVQELEDNLGRALDRSTEIERDYLYKLAEFESELQSVKNEREELIKLNENKEKELLSIQHTLKENQQELKNTKNRISNDSLSKSLNNNNNIENNNNKVPQQNMNTQIVPPPPPIPPQFDGGQLNSFSSSTSTFSSPGQFNVNNNVNNGETNSININKSIPPIPPPIIPKPPMFNCPLAPPFAGLMQAPDGAMTIKRKVQTKYKLPSLNWVALKPNQVRGTIFNELNDEKIYKEIDFLDFEEKFKIGIAGGIMNGSTEVDGKNPPKRHKPESVSLLDHTRLRNVAIFLKKLGVSIDTVVKSINNLDLKGLSLDRVEILQKMIPTDDEIKAYRKYVIDKKDVNILTDEDKFMYQLTKIERISTKLYIMNYMGNYFENINSINPQIYAIKNASNSLKSSQKFKQLLEIILAFGNYLNSSKRGPAYGFKLQSLDNLLDTKSTDKKSCLLHYITATVRQRFMDLLNFDTELYCIEEASQFSLENITTDVTELEKGMESVKKEVEVGSKGVQNHTLKEFLHNSEDKLKKTLRDANLAKAAFSECVEYFGETSRNTDANAFFALIVRFTKAFKASDQENEQRRRLALAAAIAMDNKENAVLRNKINKKQQQEAVINELKTKTTAVREKKLLQQDEVYNGALEDILLGLKNEPYRRADAVRRSHRRRIDSNRLSKNMEEMQF